MATTNVVMRALISTIGIIFVSSCSATVGPIVSGPSGKVTRPGIVVVDPEERLRYLKEHDVSWCDQSGHGMIYPPILDVQSSTSYGLDTRYYGVYEHLTRMTDGCLNGNTQECETIIKMISEWADANAAYERTGFSKIKHEYNDSHTINAYIIKPFITSYSIAKSKINVGDVVNEKIKIWLYKLLVFNSPLYRPGEMYTPDTGPVAAHDKAVLSSGAWMAYGAMFGDDDAFQKGINQWFITLDALRDDGSMPTEACRGAKATLYSAITMNGLISIAEMARLQGIDLYGMSPSPNKTIHKAVDFLVAALLDKNVILKYAKANHIPGTDRDYRDQIQASYFFAWTYAYVSRFPNLPAAEKARVFALAYSLGKTDSEWVGGDAQCFWRTF